jgi:phytoene dehydrogenase-like protein
MEPAPIIIVGGGLAGLACARRLQGAGVPYLLLEASDRVGGRVRTESVQGFQLDVGFQVLLTSYPAARQQLDMEALRLGRFQSGALIRRNGKFVHLADPWREPRRFLTAALAPVGSLADKLRLAWLRYDVGRGAADALLERPETTTADHLRQRGFSPRLIDSFFRPFFGGVFLESELQTSSRKFEYLFRLFSSGEAALPAGGMGQIPAQMASELPPDRIRLQTRVRAVSAHSVQLANGDSLTARQVILACDPWQAQRLLGATDTLAAHAARVLYFAAPSPPINAPILVLNGDGQGLINSLCVPSQVASEYAPAGQSLVSVSIQGDEHLTQDRQRWDQVRQELTAWFGPQVQAWRELQMYHIPHALPDQSRLELPLLQPRFTQHPSGVLLCGDWQDVASIQGALQSGWEVAQAWVSNSN